jgi:hypothetical protein
MRGLKICAKFELENEWFNAKINGV